MRKRSSYRPREVVDPLAIFAPVEKAKANVMMIRYLSAVEAMGKGSAGVEEMRDLADVVNFVETLTVSMKRMEKDEVMPIVQAATSGLVQATESAVSGRYQLTGWALEAVEVLVDIYRQGLERLSAHEMVMAQNITARRVAELQRQRKPNARLIKV